MLPLATLAAISAATVFVVMMARSFWSLLLRTAGLGIIALLWMPATILWVDAFADPAYHKDYVVGSILMFWVFVFIAAVSLLVRLFVLLLRMRKADRFDPASPDMDSAQDPGRRD